LVTSKRRLRISPLLFSPDIFELLVVATYYATASLALLNIGSINCPEFTNVVLCLDKIASRIVVRGRSPPLAVAPLTVNLLRIGATSIMKDSGELCHLAEACFKQFCFLFSAGAQAIPERPQSLH
jgi:hypothetical protein